MTSEEIMSTFNIPDTLSVIKISSSANGNCFSFTDLNRFNTFNPNDIVDVQFYPPAVKMFFRDGTVTVATPHGEDEYDPEMGMIVCILKYIWKGKTYNNFFRKWLKIYENDLRDIEKYEEEQKEWKEIQERKAAKNAERKRKRAEARKEREIEIMAEAIRRAKEDSTYDEDDGR